MTREEDIAEAMRRLGQAYRGDWSDFDGRSLKLELEELAVALLADDEFDLEGWTFEAGICPVARAWLEHCDERSEGVHRYSCNHYNEWLNQRRDNEQ